MFSVLRHNIIKLSRCVTTGGSNQRQVKLRSTGLLGADSTAANSRGSQGANVHDHSSSRTADQAADHGSATRTSGPVSGKPAELSNAAKYLKQVVFNDKAWAQRKPMTDYWLQHTSAPNKTLEEYRGRVDTYLKSQEFQDRWKALKNQVRVGHRTWGLCGQISVIYL